MCIYILYIKDLKDCTVQCILLHKYTALNIMEMKSVLKKGRKNPLEYNIEADRFSISSNV